MDNYFNYFTEIEEHFQRRRGTLLILSPLDWALMETWKDAGIPLEAVLRGIDATFDKWERRPSRTRKVNGLAFCSQEVLASVEEMKEAAVGAASPDKEKRESGLDQSAVAEYLTRNAGLLAQLQLPATATVLSDGDSSDVAQPGGFAAEQCADRDGRSGATPDGFRGETFCCAAGNDAG